MAMFTEICYEKELRLVYQCETVYFSHFKSCLEVYYLLHCQITKHVWYTKLHLTVLIKFLLSERNSVLLRVLVSFILMINSMSQGACLLS